MSEPVDSDDTGRGGKTETGRGAKTDRDEPRLPRNLTAPTLFDSMLIDTDAVARLFRRKRQAWLDAQAAAVSEEHLRKLHKMLMGTEAMPRELESPVVGHRLGGGGWTERDEAELQEHLMSGFLNWTQKDLMAFKGAMLKHGGRRAAVLHMQHALPHKDPAEVARCAHNQLQRPAAAGERAPS